MSRKLKQLQFRDLKGHNLGWVMVAYVARIQQYWNGDDTRARANS